MPKSRPKTEDENHTSPYLIARWTCWAIATAIFLAFVAIALGFTQVETLAPGAAVVFVVLEFTLIVGGLGAGLGYNKREVMAELEMIEDRVAEVVSAEVGKLQPAISSDLGRLSAQLEQIYVQLIKLREEQTLAERRIMDQIAEFSVKTMMQGVELITKELVARAYVEGWSGAEEKAKEEAAAYLDARQAVSNNVRQIGRSDS